MTREQQEIPEYLPGEPREPELGAVGVARELAKKGFFVLLSALIFTKFWLPYLILRAAYGRPPMVPAQRQFLRYLRHIWQDRPAQGSRTPVQRVALTLTLLGRWLRLPFFGLAWLVDEVLYGKALDATPIVEPLFELSAGRSGSTQLAHYLEDDPHFTAPSALQIQFPYVWAWKLAPRLLGWYFTPAKIDEIMHQLLPEAFLQRHEADFFRTDTFEILFYMHHLNFIAPFVSSELLCEDFAFARSTPANREQLEGDFIDFIDRIGRKTLLVAGRGPGGEARRLMLKGHFLFAAPRLEEKYPDACFLTVIREPRGRLQSGINFLRVQPSEPLLGPVPWPWLVDFAQGPESAYNEIEMEWYRRSGGARRCIVRFVDYVRDLEGTLARIYRECLGSEALPPHLPREHAPRKRTDYLVDRTPEQLGIDITELERRQASYIRWCRGEDIAAPPASAG